MNDGTQIAATSKMSILFEFARGAHWEDVAHRCKTHPDEAKSKEQDQDGFTILHWACHGASPETPGRLHPVFFVVEAILLGSPELATIPASGGILPVHLACAHALSSDIIRALIQAYPPSAGIVVDSWGGGMAPLHLLCRNHQYMVTTDSVRAVLECSAGVASTRLKDQSGETPRSKLDCQLQAYEIFSQLASLQRLKDKPSSWRGPLRSQRQDQIATKTKALLGRIQATGYWEKVELLALAEYTQQPLVAPGGASCFESTTTTFHALVSLWNFTHSTIALASFMIPQDLMQEDEHGDLPLHLATRGKCDRLIRDIVSAQPLAAAIPDGTGALPLQIYLDRSHVQSWCPVIKKLICASPPAVKRLGLDCRLYPLLWSRLNMGPIRMINPSGDLSTLFLSIQSAPEVFCLL